MTQRTCKDSSSRNPPLWSRPANRSPSGVPLRAIESELAVVHMVPVKLEAVRLIDNEESDIVSGLESIVCRPCHRCGDLDRNQFRFRFRLWGRCRLLSLFAGCQHRQRHEDQCGFHCFIQLVLEAVLILLSENVRVKDFRLDRFFQGRQRCYLAEEAG